MLEVKFQAHCDVTKHRVIAALDIELASGGIGTTDTAENVQAAFDSWTGYYFRLVLIICLSEVKSNAKSEVAKHSNMLLKL